MIYNQGTSSGFFVTSMYYKNVLIKFASGMELGRIVSILEDRIKIQNDPAKLEKWPKKPGCNSKNKFEDLQLGKNN